MKIAIGILMMMINQSCRINFLQEKNNPSFDDIYKNLKQDWIFAREVKRDNFYNVDLKEQKGIEFKLFSLVFVRPESPAKLVENCLYFKMPTKEKGGILMIEENKNLNDCGETSGFKPKYEIEDVVQVKYFFEDEKLKLNFEVKEGHQNKKITWSFPMININDGPSTFHKFLPEKKNKKLPLLTIITSNEAQFEDNRYKDFASSKGQVFRCRRLNSECQIAGEDLCEKCPYGSFPAVGEECATDYDRYCGPNFCGEKGEPACPRGLKTKESDDDGFCEEGSVPQFENSLLICK